MALSITHVDAFTSQPFSGNPAAVCLLTEERAAAWMQSVAREMNLSETAFLLPRQDWRPDRGPPRLSSGHRGTKLMGNLLVVNLGESKAPARRT